MLIKVADIVFFVFAEEMDWDKNGMVNFKEFIFAFEKWIGIEDGEEDEEEVADEQE